MEDYSKYTVFILGAGLGTRLRPLTDIIPKVMVPIYKDRPLLEHTILLLRRQGFKDFVVNLHYLPRVITDHFGDGSRFGVKVRYSNESDGLMETGGALKKVESILSDDFVFIYGDELHFFDFRKLIEFYKKKKALGTIVLNRSNDPWMGDIAELDSKTQKIVKWHPRPHNIKEFKDNQFLNAGLYVLSKEIVKNIPKDTPARFDIHTLPPLIASGTDIYGFPAEEEILDIGTPEKYEFAKKWYMQNIKKSPFNDSQN